LAGKFNKIFDNMTFAIGLLELILACKLLMSLHNVSIRLACRREHGRHFSLELWLARVEHGRHFRRELSERDLSVELAKLILTSKFNQSLDELKFPSGLQALISTGDSNKSLGKVPLFQWLAEVVLGKQVQHELRHSVLSDWPAGVSK